MIRAPDDDRYIPPMPGQYFDVVLMQADVPIVEKRYVLTLPADKRLISQEYNGAIFSRTSYTADSTEYVWWVKDMPARPDEPRQPDEPDVVPKVVMTTAPSWQAKSKWFFDVNKNQFEVTDAIREHVRKVLAAAGLTLKSDPMKIAAALNHWVAQNIRYSGQTMGEGEGFTLHPSDMLFEYRSGVCKDIASMSITLLRAAGLQTYPAMTMAGSRIEDIPADQFNHCVVAWERKPGDFVMLDPTWVPFNNDIWSKLETEQDYLVGSPRGEGLSRIPYSPPEESPLRVRHTAGLDASGNLEGTLRLEGSGAMDSRLRRIVAGTARRRFGDRMAAMLAPVSPAIDIVRATSRRPDDFDGDMWIEIRYRIPGFALPVAGGLEFSSPAMAVLLHDGLLFRAGAAEWPEKRESDLFFYYTELLDAEETIRLPRGWAAVHLAEPVSVDSTYAAFEGASSVAERDLVIRSRAEVRRRQIPPGGYAGFREAMRAARAWGDAPFRVEPAAGKEEGR